MPTLTNSVVNILKQNTHFSVYEQRKWNLSRPLNSFCMIQEELSSWITRVNRLLDLVDEFGFFSL